jgi:hypothetical protein
MRRKIITSADGGLTRERIFLFHLGTFQQPKGKLVEDAELFSPEGFDFFRRHQGIRLVELEGF